MTPTDKAPRQIPNNPRQFSVNYTQGDVDTIRQQIEQGEAAKRRLLFLILMVTLVALVGAIVVASSCYGLYSKGESEKSKIASDFSALKKLSDQCDQQLGAKRAEEARIAQAQKETQDRMGKLLPLALSAASSQQGAELAQRVYQLPDHKIEVDQKPPDTLFHNWRARSDSSSDIYTLVGGFLDGKWVIYSNLVARRSDSTEE